MSTLVTGSLYKMRSELSQPVAYHLPLGDELVPMNSYLGQVISLRFDGEIHCIHCQRLTKKSFNQGYCFPCVKKLAQCDTCIIKPELCHYFAGTCREPQWGEAHCLQDHIVYLANSSGVKIGITRQTQVPTRWIDQGAVQALPIMRVSNRLQAGLSEILFAKHVADKTNWRTMLKGDIAVLDLYAERDRLLASCELGITELQQQYGLQALQFLPDAEQVTIHYPVIEYPTKITSLNFDKEPLVQGTLLGIKGQYLLFDTGVINMSKFAGYSIQLTAP